jgi:hypothetical protein
LEKLLQIEILTVDIATDCQWRIHADNIRKSGKGLARFGCEKFDLVDSGETTAFDGGNDLVDAAHLINVRRRVSLLLLSILSADRPDFSEDLRDNDKNHHRERGCPEPDNEAD